MPRNQKQQFFTFRLQGGRGGEGAHWSYVWVWACLGVYCFSWSICGYIWNVNDIKLSLFSESSRRDLSWRPCKYFRAGHFSRILLHKAAAQRIIVILESLISLSRHLSKSVYRLPFFVEKHQVPAKIYSRRQLLTNLRKKHSLPAYPCTTLRTRVIFSWHSRKRAMWNLQTGGGRRRGGKVGSRGL